MKLLTATLPALLVAGGAYAMDRYDVTKMSLKKSRRHFILRTGRSSSTFRDASQDLLLYGMYAADPPVCKGGQTAVWRTVPASDLSTCPVLQCADNSRSMSR